jgi:hypothetical protein
MISGGRASSLSSQKQHSEVAERARLPAAIRMAPGRTSPLSVHIWCTCLAPGRKPVTATSHRPLARGNYEVRCAELVFLLSIHHFEHLNLEIDVFVVRDLAIAIGVNLAKHLLRF